MILKLLTIHHLEFLSVKGGCTGSSGSILVKMSNCWKSHVAAQLLRKEPTIVARLQTAALFLVSTVQWTCTFKDIHSVNQHLMKYIIEP